MTPELFKHLFAASVVGMDTTFVSESDRDESHIQDLSDDNQGGSVMRGLAFGSLFSAVFYALGFAGWELVSR